MTNLRGWFGGEVGRLHLRPLLVRGLRVLVVRPELAVLRHILEHTAEAAHAGDRQLDLVHLDLVLGSILAGLVLLPPVARSRQRGPAQLGHLVDTGARITAFSLY